MSLASKKLSYEEDRLNLSNRNLNKNIFVSSSNRVNNDGKLDF